MILRLQEATHEYKHELLDHTSTGMAYNAFMNSNTNNILPTTYFTRISYMFTKWIDESLGTMLSLLTPARIGRVQRLVMNGGKWDLYHYWHDKSDQTKGKKWYEPYGLTFWDKEIAHGLYLKRFQTLVAFCNRVASLKCSWATSRPGKLYVRRVRRLI